VGKVVFLGLGSSSSSFFADLPLDEEGFSSAFVLDLALFLGGMFAQLKCVILSTTTIITEKGS